MEIPIGAEVQCVDGPCGRTTYVLINPTTEDLTHLVVGNGRDSHPQRMVPLTQVLDATSSLVRLRCTTNEFKTFDDFIETQYIKSDVPYYDYEPGDYWMWPYVVPNVSVAVDHLRLPPGELAITRTAQVHATDGLAGRVDEFMVDPVSGHITHLILRRGHLWGRRDVTIPVSDIDRLEGNAVYVKLSKADVGQLPAVPIRRRGRRTEAEATLRRT